MKQPNKVRMEEIKKALLAASKELNKPVRDLTRNDVEPFGASEHKIKKVGGLQLIKDRYFPLTEKELVQIRKAKAEVSYSKKLEKDLAEKLDFEESLVSAVKNLKIPQVNSFKTKDRKVDRILTLVLSDLHIGSDISADETGSLDFGRVEEARRLAAIVKQVCSYKRLHRSTTELNVLLLGDIIQNLLHDPRAGANLTEQFERALSLLLQALMVFSTEFKKVTVRCSPGNHGRNISRHHGRAVNEKWDSVENNLYLALKYATSHVKNIDFVIPKTPYVTFDVFGKKAFATHGDTVINPGYPGKAIRIGAIENQINRINANLKDSDEYSLFIVGHVHTASITHMSNGAVMVTNGPMVPVDAYAVSIGLFECQTGQYLIESTPDYPVGDVRYIIVTAKDDKDSSLDKIIKPYGSR